jgi:hypothetical protein
MKHVIIILSFVCYGVIGFSQTNVTKSNTGKTTQKITTKKDAITPNKKYGVIADKKYVIISKSKAKGLNGPIEAERPKPTRFIPTITPITPTKPE